MREAGRESGLTKLAGGVKKLGQAIVATTAAATALAVAFGTKAVSAASDLEQSIGAIDDVFKGAAGQMHGLAKEAANAVGLSRNSYNELALIIGTQLKNGGTAIDQLGQKTNELITLGSDLAAGFGGSTQEAVEAISSALKGERDPIEKYGVSLRQAAIDAKAAELGFTKVGGSLSQEASNAATLALIMEQTTDMHGKFGREADTLAHKQQVLAAQFENVKATIGTYLLPAVSAVVGAVSARLGPALENIKTWIETRVMPALSRLWAQVKTNVLPALSELGAQIKTNVLPALQSAGTWVTSTLVPGVVSLTTALWDNRDIILPIAAAVGTIVVALKGYYAAINTAKALTTAFTLAQKLLTTTMAVNPIFLLVTAIAALVAGLVAAYNSSETFRTVVQAVLSAIQTCVGAVVNWVATYVGPTLSAVWEAITAGLGLLADIFTVIWNNISTAVSIAVGAISAVLSPTIGFISGIFSAVSQVASAVWSVAWNIFYTAVSTAWAIVSGIIRGISGYVSGIFNAIRALISGNWRGAWEIFKSTVSTAWSNVKSAISSGVSGVLATIRSLPSKIVSALGNTGRLLWDAGGKIISGFISGITSGFSKVKDTLSTLTSWLPDWKGPAPRDAKLLTKNGQLVIDGFVTGLESRFGKVRRTLGGLTSAIPGMVSTSGTLSTAFTTTDARAERAAVYEIHVHQLATTPETGRQIVNAIREYENTSGRRLA
ncbi:hypothetical protein R3J22_03800 [Trueperella bernardiae]|uniref:phage tail protein n=1 Tax=Trueperella bernardiae TaxID=59561 RepID=UPI00294A8AA4|nr:hypothetical protein [Trueperella bernardiae]MDV6238653.1 hypothetical protein [Trueperella bernardiae]